MPSDLLDDIDIDTVIGPAPSDVLLALPGLAAQPLAGGPVVDAEQILTCNVNTLTVTCENLRQQLARRSDIETLLNTVNAGVAALAGADAEGSTGLIWKEKKLGRMTILNQELCSRVAQLDAEMHTKDATIEQLMAVQSRTAAEKATLISERAAAVDAASVKATALGAVERQLTTANERLRVAVKMSSVLALGLLAAGEGSQCDETHALEFVGRMFVDSLKAMTELNKYSTRIQRVARGHQVRRVASSLLASAGVRIPSAVSTFVLDQPGALPPSPIIERLLPLAWCLARADAESSRCSSLRAVLRASRSDLHRSAREPVRSLLNSYAASLKRDCIQLAVAFKRVISKETADKAVDARPRLRNSADQYENPEPEPEAPAPVADPKAKKK